MSDRAASGTVFEYEPLDVSQKQIRIVELHPSEDGDAVSCTVHHVCLGDNPAYETVSYCWGDPSIRSTCFLNGHALSIPLSSVTVLRQARDPIDPRYLWIDALCINQDDSRERDEQVALMREIYSSSIENLIFLDVDPNVATSSVGLFERLWTEARAFTNDFETMDTIIGQSAGSKDTLDDEDTAAYFAVVFSPWFRRVWVMQEAALAPMSACYIGSYKFPLVDLLRAFRWREYRYHYSGNTNVDPTSVNTALRNILTLWRYVDPSHGPYRKQDGACIADALVFARGLNSTQRRDHVYGLLGLIRYRKLPIEIMEKLRPAYSRSILDVFRDATVAALMEREGIPDLIFEELFYESSYCPTDSDVKSWPSWVPSWSLARDLDINPGRLNKWWFSASGETKFDIEEVDERTIRVRGILIDAVVNTTSICRSREWNLSGELEKVSIWIQEAESLCRFSGERDVEGHQELKSTLLAGLNGESRPVQAQDLDTFQKARQMLASHDSGLDPRSKRLIEVFERACNNRRFFSTLNGYVGIGPNVMQPEDVVVVLFGCRAPILLRPRDSHYTIVGECYVHSIMNGEMIRTRSERSEMFALK